MGLFKGSDGCKLVYLSPYHELTHIHGVLVHVCFSLCVCICVCANMCRPEVNMRCISQNLDTLIFETGPSMGLGVSRLI